MKHGKHLAFKAARQQCFIHCDSRGDGYSEDAIREWLSNKRVVAPRTKTAAIKSAPAKPNLLIDIQAKMRQAQSPGYERWLKIFNLKEMAKTLTYLQEHGLTDYDALAEATKAATEKTPRPVRYDQDQQRPHGGDHQLQKQIGGYHKTRDMYTGDVKDGKKESFYETHRAAIVTYEAAKKYFNEHGYNKDKKLPRMETLKREYAIRAAANKKLYSQQKQAQQELVELLTIKSNTDRILADPSKEKTRGVGSRGIVVMTAAQILPVMVKCPP